MITIDKKYIAWLNQWRVIIYHDNEYDGEHWFTTEAEADAFIASVERKDE